LPYTPCPFQNPVNRRCYLSRIHIKEIERIKKKKRRRRTNLFGLPPLHITLQEPASNGTKREARVRTNTSDHQKTKKGKKSGGWERKEKMTSH
jgi:hypothetical protein